MQSASFGDEAGFILDTSCGAPKQWRDSHFAVTRPIRFEFNGGIERAELSVKGGRSWVKVTQHNSLNAEVRRMSAREFENYAAEAAAAATAAYEAGLLVRPDHLPRPRGPITVHLRKRSVDSSVQSPIAPPCSAESQPSSSAMSEARVPAPIEPTDVQAAKLEKNRLNPAKATGEVGREAFKQGFPADSNVEEFLTFKEVMLLLKLGRSTLYEKIKRGSKGYDPEVPVPVKIGHCTRFRKSEVQEYMRNRPRKGH